MPKTLLLAGLGKYASTDPSSLNQFGPASGIQAAVAADMATLTSQGYVCTNIDLNPHDPEDTIARVRAMLEFQLWDGFVIGFGLRGNKDYTALFEQVVNLGVEVTGGRVRFGFSPKPDGLVETIGRIFPEGAA